ncbi:uncharacterized protein [Nothobranchius furzeri]|uniref:uncharacterized protein n=1 Tax=Nothobranchius furzeri TaxID=105023 RepID=UPI003904B538
MRTLNSVPTLRDMADLHASLLLYILCGSTLVQAIDSLQKAFFAVQHSLLLLKLVLNADKTKLMLFSKSRNLAQIIPSVTTLEGHGVFASEPIEKGSFVVEYSGELISEHERDKRQKKYTEKQTAFLFDFKWKNNTWCIDASREDDSLGRLVTDDHKYPNCKMKELAVQDKPHLCLFAIDNIQAESEITHDYGESMWPWRALTPSVETMSQPPTDQETPSVETLSQTPTDQETPSVETMSQTPTDQETPSVETMSQPPTDQETPSVETTSQPPTDQETPSVETMSQPPTDQEVSGKSTSFFQQTPSVETMSQTPTDQETPSVETMSQPPTDQEVSENSLHSSNRSHIIFCI